jgi:hypothetical protein
VFRADVPDFLQSKKDEANEEVVGVEKGEKALVNQAKIFGLLKLEAKEDIYVV